MVISNNQTTNSIERFTNTSTSSKDLIHFFLLKDINRHIEINLIVLLNALR